MTDEQMTDMTQDELNAIINAAKARQSDITPAPWVFDKYQHAIHYTEPLEEGRHGSKRILAVNAEISPQHGGVTLMFSNRATQELITAAPTLNAAVIALDAELNRVKSAWEVEATANLDLTKELQAARARITALTEIGFLPN